MSMYYIIAPQEGLQTALKSVEQLSDAVIPVVVWNN
jgi:hypothetical protein